MGESQKGASTGGGRHGGVGTCVRKSEEKERASFVADRKDSTGRGCTIDIVQWTNQEPMPKVAKLLLDTGNSYRDWTLPWSK